MGLNRTCLEIKHPGVYPERHQPQTVRKDFVLSSREEPLVILAGTLGVGKRIPQDISSDPEVPLAVSRLQEARLVSRGRNESLRKRGCTGVQQTEESDAGEGRWPERRHTCTMEVLLMKKTCSIAIVATSEMRIRRNAFAIAGSHPIMSNSMVWASWSIDLHVIIKCGRSGLDALGLVADNAFTIQKRAALATQRCSHKIE